MTGMIVDIEEIYAYLGWRVKQLNKNIKGTGKNSDLAWYIAGQAHELDVALTTLRMRYAIVQGKVPVLKQGKAPVPSLRFKGGMKMKVREALSDIDKFAKFITYGRKDSYCYYTVDIVRSVLIKDIKGTHESDIVICHWVCNAAKNECVKLEEASKYLYEDVKTMDVKGGSNYIIRLKDIELSSEALRADSPCSAPVPASGWISAKDRLPVMSGRYLVLLNGNNKQILFFNAHLKVWNTEDKVSKDVTHWMTFPDLPKEERE